MTIVLTVGCSIGGHAQTAEESCSPVDLRASFGNTRSQEDTDACSIFAQADLIGEALGIRPPDMVSALDLAVVSQAVTTRSLLAAGWTEDGIAELSRFGSLLTRIPKRVLDAKLGDETYHTYWDWLIFQSRGKICLESQAPSERVLKARTPSPLERPAPKRRFLEEVGDRYAKQFAIEGSEEGVPASWIMSRWRTDLDRKCGDRPELKTLKTTILTVGGPFLIENTVFKAKKVTKDHLRLALWLRLNSSRPAAIGFDVQPFSNFSTSHLDHTSLAVGRRWNKDKRKCEVLVRNSWGRRCDLYAEGIECKDGYFWVAEEELAPRLYEVRYLDAAAF